MIISSKDNKIIKYAKRLQDKKFAIKESKTLIESPKIIKELLSMGIVDTIIINQKSHYLHELDQICKNMVVIDDKISDCLSQTETTTGVFAIVKLPKLSNNISNKVLILDNIQDPTNLGAIFRSAAAFGYNTILDVNCCFAYSSKVTRCSMGNNFKLNIIKCSYDDIKEIKAKEKLSIICCNMNGKDVKNSLPIYDKFAIIIGNEGNGVAKELIDIADEVLAIPMQNEVESLNASVTASIIMYAFS